MSISSNQNIYNRILDADFLPGLLAQIQTVADLISRQGWAEANAGNISINITQEVKPMSESSTEWFIVSRTGSRYRSMAHDPLPHLVFVALENGVEQMFPANAKPTSEWDCHLLLQQQMLAHKREAKVILHAHPVSIIALSHLDIYHDELLLNHTLKEVLPELAFFLPDGVATTPYTPFGSQELAQCSLRSIGTRNALIWQGHGIVCTGKTPDEALDCMEVAEKAAQLVIYRNLLTK